MAPAKKIRAMLGQASEKIEQILQGTARTTQTPGALLNEEDAHDLNSKITKAYALLTNGSDYGNKSNPKFGEALGNSLAQQSELFLFCAETSLKANNLEICNQSLNWFFINYPNKSDEFVVRAHFCKAEYEAIMALRSFTKGDVCPILVVLHACRHLWKRLMLVWAILLLELIFVCWTRNAYHF